MTSTWMRPWAAAGLLLAACAASIAAESPIAPHERQPDLRPYPEYVAEALALTNLKVDERFRSIRLRLSPQRPLGALVLPVQTEAYGFAPAFRALAGAALDQALADRRLAANRQTEVLDVSGPYARRFDERTVQAFAQQQPQLPLLALYLGHDGGARVFVTLERRDGGQRRVAHRTLPLAQTPLEALAPLAALLPALLDDVGLAAPPRGSAPPAAAATACRDDAWSLATPAADEDAATRACRALAIGTLMPFFDGGGLMFPLAGSPARHAWLAAAYLEAARWPGAPPAAQAVRALAASQLQVHPLPPPELALASSPDPVAGRVARLLAAWPRSETSPASSQRAQVERVVGEAAAGLPPFTRTVFAERGILGEAFHRIDLCALELQLPGAMPGARCRGPAVPGTASAEQQALFREWRIATYHNDIRHFGQTLGQRESLAQLLATMPDDVARHPFVRQRRFMVERSQEMPAGDFAAYLARVREQAASFAQSSADLQAFSAAFSAHAISQRPWVQNTRVLNDPAVAALVDAEWRLYAVLKSDRFTSTSYQGERVAAGERLHFLAPGLAQQAQRDAQAALAAKAPPAAPPPGARVPLMRAMGTPVGYPPSEATMRAAVAANPGSIEERVWLAVRLLKEGKPEAEALQLIDELPRDRRSDQRVAQSHAWAFPADVLFFASDLANAKVYYQRVRDIGTGSESDLVARVRLPLIAGDLGAAATATAARLKRYDSDFARRDLAGLMFMTGASPRAWELLQPRLGSTRSMQLWSAALVGHRVERRDLRAVQAWAQAHGLQGAQVEFDDAIVLLMHLHAVVDRVPQEADIELLRTLGGDPDRNARWVASARLARMAWTGNFDGYAEVRALLARSDPQKNRFLLPRFIWPAWATARDADIEPEGLVPVGVASFDFDDLLAKAVWAALAGHVDRSVAFLRGARYQMADFGYGPSLYERRIPVAYDYALTAYLLFRHTRNEAFRTEALRFAHAHQSIHPSWAWAYALEALLTPDEQARAVAFCCAQYLDRDSHFLALARQAAGGRAPACAKTPWPALRSTLLRPEGP